MTHPRHRLAPQQATDSAASSRVRRRAAHLRHVRGVVLIDSLVAILIFSLGVLGIVALQAVSIVYSRDAKYRAQAALLADGVVADMWAVARNPAALNDFATGGSGFSAWSAQVAAALPGADTDPPRITIIGTEVTVEIHWSSGNSPHRYICTTGIRP